MNGLLRKVLTIGFVVVFLVAIGSAFFKRNMLAYAAGTIYIRANGLVEGTDKIANENNVTYMFTDDINDCIVVERSNIIIDGDEFTLNGSWSLMYGFNLTSVSNVTIKNVNIVRFGYATWLEGASQCVVSDNTCVDDEGGIWLVSSVGCTVLSNNIVRSVEGVALDSSSGNTITGNNITDCYYGVYVRENSIGNTISGNYIKETGNGAGIYLNESPDNVISGNDIRDSPNEHICLLYSSNNNTIFGNTLTNSTADVGVYVYQCSLNSFFGNNITDNANSGIRLDSSADSTVSENNISENLNGVYLWYSSNITVSGNDIAANNASGIILDGSGNNIISRNNITENNWWGINPAYSNNNTISGNNIRNNNCGINSANSNFNIVSANNIIDNVYSGIYLESSSNSTFHHNNLINNTSQAVVEEPGYANNWDDGYPSGGNYWSEYTDIDNNSGPDQTITGIPDGIWDHPYIIDVNNTDHYPLKFPYETRPPTITILSPENKTYTVNASIPLTFTVDEFVSWMGYSLNGQPNIDITGNTTLPTLSDGGHCMTVYANDTFDNMGFATIYFTVDTTKPDITNVVQDPLTDILPDTTVKINATVTDATSKVKQVLLNCTFTNNTSTWYEVFSMTHLTGEIWNATILALPYGINVTYVIIAEDNAGNTVTTEQIFGYKYEYTVVPEFTLLAILLAFMMTTLFLAIVFRKKRTFLIKNRTNKSFHFSAL